MNKEQARGTLRNVAGMIQEQAGRLVGNKEQEARGIHRQVIGHVEKSVGDVKAVLKGASDAIQRASRRR